MTYHRTITAFVAIVLFAAATTAAGMRAQAPTEREVAGTMTQKPMAELKKPVRYEAIIWKRHRSTVKSSG